MDSINFVCFFVIILNAILGHVNSTITFTCEQYQAWGVSHYPCATGNECVLGYYECDSILDCADGSDEDHCEADWEVQCVVDYAGKKTTDGKALQSFQCGDGMCILGCKRCDGKFDCLDKSDEDGCDKIDFGQLPPCN